MAKINLRTSLHNKTENKFFNNEVVAILDEKQTIKYLDNNVTVVIEKLDNSVTIIRRCDEYEVHLFLEKNKKTKGYYDVKSIGKLDMETYTTKLEINDNNIDIEYTMTIESQSKTDFRFYAEYIN